MNDPHPTESRGLRPGHPMGYHFHLGRGRLLQLRQPSPRRVWSALIWAVHPCYCLRHEAHLPGV
eukprot:4732883-Pyramimonas_sp.AAC.1